MKYLINHTAWVAILLCYAAFVLWVTYEVHISPKQEDEDEYPKIDDLY
jgi:hypothetical protein